MTFQIVMPLYLKNGKFYFTKYNQENYFGSKYGTKFLIKYKTLIEVLIDRTCFAKIYTFKYDFSKITEFDIILLLIPLN